MNDYRLSLSDAVEDRVSSATALIMRGGHVLDMMAADRFSKAEAAPTVGAEVIGYLVAALCNAPLYWISRDMVALAEHASRSMPDETPLACDQPSPGGCVLFESPLSRPCGDGMISQAGFVWVQRRASGCVVGLIGDSAGILAANNKPSGCLDWRFAIVAVDEFTYDEPVVGGLPEVDRNYDDVYRRQFPRALWALCKQRLARVHKADLPRPVARRLGKAGVPLPAVHVVTLRKFDAANSVASGNDVEWSHRWMVSGHWRNQYLPSAGTHRMQWIAPYVKGPDDKPLVINEMVSALVR